MDYSYQLRLRYLARREFDHLEPEEFEVLANEKRQEIKVKEMMLNAIDDLKDSNSVENSYCDSSTNYESDTQKHSNDRKLLSNESPIDTPKSSPRFKSPGCDNYQQLQILYQDRLREIDQLRSHLENFKESSNKEKAHLSKRIDRLEAEKQKALSLAESLKLTKDNTAADLREKVSKLESDLEEKVKECDTVKKIFNKVCVTKDSLVENDFLIERGMADLKKEKHEINELIKNLTTENDQLAEKLKTLQSKFANQKKELENLVTNHEDELQKNSLEHIHELESLKRSLKNVHRDQLSKLKLKYVEKLLKIKSSLKKQLLQNESKVEKEALRVFSEEIELEKESFEVHYEKLFLHSLDLEDRLKEKTANYDSLKKQMDEMKFSQEGEERSELRRFRTDLKNIKTATVQFRVSQME